MTAAQPANDVDQRMAGAREWDHLVARARRRPGFEDFLRLPSLDRLLPVAAHGPVVVLNVSARRCDAIALTTEGVQVIPLPDVTATAVETHAHAYLAGDHDGLTWLWDALAEPVLETLGLSPGDDPGRLWWCPTGLLTLLPIHAAGRHDRAGSSVLDRVISSFTPSLRALIDARRPAAPAPGRLLFAGSARAPGRPFLPSTERERQILQTLLPYDRSTLLPAEQTTRARVLDALPGHGWVHFSCHADQDLRDPSRGGLLLGGELLTVEELGARRFRGEFAFLAGCRTAVGGVRLSDEALTLATALHYAGFRHVIGTLAEVTDRRAADVAEAIYPRLIRDGVPDATGAAAALHEAQRGLRERFGHRHAAWAPFTHTGP